MREELKDPNSRVVNVVRGKVAEGLKVVSLEREGDGILVLRLVH